MSRFFIAITLPDEVKDRLAAIRLPSMPGVRRIGRPEMHLTLQFLGDVSRPEIEIACEALHCIHASAFTLAINGVGRFPPTGPATVLWAGVDCSPQLLELNQRIGTALMDAIAFRPEARPYSPHITTARLKTSVPRSVIESYLEENRSFQTPAFAVKEFSLYSSVRVAGLPQYSEEFVFQLFEASP